MNESQDTQSIFGFSTNSSRFLLSVHEFWQLVLVKTRVHLGFYLDMRKKGGRYYTIHFGWRGVCHSVLNVQAKKDPDEDKRRKGEVGKMHEMHREGAVLCIAASDLVHRQPWWGGSLKRVWLRFLGKEVGIINVNLENSREVWQMAKHFTDFLTTSLPMDTFQQRS